MSNFEKQSIQADRSMQKFQEKLLATYPEAEWVHDCMIIEDDKTALDRVRKFWEEICENESM